MKERPILFSGESICGILDLRKTKTRRVIKPQPNHFHDFSDGKGWRPQIDDREILCPYGKLGDLLWVRETFGVQLEPCEEYPNGYVIYRADLPTDSTFQYEGGGSAWHPSIFMPRWASRITLKILNVRVERLQEISEVEAIKEGIEPKEPNHVVSAIYRYAQLWNSINAKRGYPWDSNPWVWVIEFEKEQP